MKMKVDKILFIITLFKDMKELYLKNKKNSDN